MMQTLQKPYKDSKLRAVIGMLDPTLQDVSLSKDSKDTFITRRGGTEIIIIEGDEEIAKELQDGNQSESRAENQNEQDHWHL